MLWLNIEIYSSALIALAESPMFIYLFYLFYYTCEYDLITFSLSVFKFFETKYLLLVETCSYIYSNRIIYIKKNLQVDSSLQTAVILTDCWPIVSKSYVLLNYGYHLFYRLLTTAGSWRFSVAVIENYISFSEWSLTCWK